MRLVETGGFTIAGTRVYITGQDNSQFAAFWQQANADGTVDRLKALAKPDGETGCRILGASRVENDPDCRAFDFYIGAEVAKSTDCGGFERFAVTGGLWAVFAGDGGLPEALLDAELEAFLRWLPDAPYRHDRRPELEVYPEDGRARAEFWLPIVPK